MKKPTQKVKSKKRSRQRKTSIDGSLSAVTAIEDNVENGGAGSEVKVASPIQKKAVQVKKEKSEGAFSRIFSKTGQFLRDAKTELKKVKWPTRKELLASTAVVIVLTILIAIFLGLVDFGLIKIIKNII